VKPSILPTGCPHSVARRLRRRIRENTDLSSRVIAEHWPSRPPSYAVGMWDVLTWHHGTLAIAWWAVIVLIVALLSIGGASAARRK